LAVSRPDVYRALNDLVPGLQIGMRYEEVFSLILEELERLKAIELEYLLLTKDEQ
jgi:hypothetical protein